MAITGDIPKVDKPWIVYRTICMMCNVRLEAVDPAFSGGSGFAWFEEGTCRNSCPDTTDGYGHMPSRQMTTQEELPIKPRARSAAAQQVFG